MAPSRGLSILQGSPKLSNICHRCHARLFATTLPSPSGHNRWSKIKHDKGKADAVKNRQRSIFSQELATASRLFGPDLNGNPRLADLITKAKREGFAKASIEAAIARGQGRSLSGLSLESVTVEGMLPGNVGVIVECETDNRLRTLAGLKLSIKESGGTATPCNYLFEKKGRVVFESKEGVGAEEVLEVAIENGATDVEEMEEGGVVVYAAPEDTKAVGEAVAKALELDIRTSEIIWDPNEDTKVALPSEDVAQELEAFVDSVRDKEANIQSVAMNIAQGSLSADTWSDIQSRIVV